MMPEMDPNEVSPLAVQRPVAAQPDLSQFQDFNPLDGANFSGAFGGPGSGQYSGPTGYAIPENYGNPKNKIYNLYANPGEGIRLKAVDGTVLFEGQGPEAAAKAASIVQELGKQFGTQSTWVLDKQSVGGDWKQVSQDTVGEKKTTAVNAFLNVAAPIAGALLTPFIPGAVGLLGGAGASAAGAAGGSLINSALQNKNSAQAIKDAAIAAAGSYVGAKLAPSVSGALEGLSGGATTATPIGTAMGNGFVASSAKAAEQAAAQAALAQGIQTTVVPMIAKQGLTSAVATGLGAGLGGLTQPNFNPTVNTTVPNQDLAAKPETPVTDELVVTAQPNPGVPAVVGSTVGAGLGGLTSTPPTGPIDELVVTAQPKDDVGALTGAGVQLPTTTPVPDPVIDELVVTARPKPQPEKPLVPTPVILPNGTLNPDFVNKDFTVDSPEGKTEPKNPAEKLADWIKANPLQAASLGLTALSGLAGAKGGTGSGSTGNAPGNIGAAGTRASLSPTFNTGTLPPVSGTFAGGALSGTRTPAAMNMSTDDWLRYGLRPEKNFFAAPTPVAQEIPVKKARGGPIAGKGREPRSEFAVRGAGTGRSDDIPAVLSDGEYVMDAETVALLGDGSNKAGAEKLDQLRVNLRRHKGANLAKGRFSVNAKSPEKYLAGGRVK
jgi:hypothetical protein